MGILLRDLRIGNYIGCDGDILIVEKIDSKNNIGFSLFKKAVGQHVNSGNKYYIELTEEILLKCGFDEDDTLFHNQIALYKNSIGGFNYNANYFEYDNLIEIKYLHQLQNLYWCLCGKELEINL